MSFQTTMNYYTKMDPQQSNDHSSSGLSKLVLKEAGVLCDSPTSSMESNNQTDLSLMRQGQSFGEIFTINKYKINNSS